MKLSKTSIIYRSALFNHNLSHQYWDKMPTYNLCAFVQHYIWQLLRNIFFGFFFGAILMGIILDIVLFITIGKFDPAYSPWAFIGIAGTAVITAIIIAISIMAISLYVSEKIRKYFRHRDKEYPEEKTESIVSAYIKAKKNKYCPNLEITE